jgi:copper resistance protein B
MRRVALFLFGCLALAGPTRAQDPHAAHQHQPPASAAAPEAAAPPSQPHQHEAPPPPAEPAAANPPPAAPADHDADRYYPAATMAAARAQLSQEHGDIPWSKVMFEKLEVRPGSGVAGYGWEGRASFGGDVDRLTIKSRGDGAKTLDRGEADVLWDHAISPWLNLQAGVRQDFQRGGRTFATVGVEGMAPYEFDVNAALFLSDGGAVRGRLEAAHDYRLTQRLILEPRAELNFASQDAPKERVGSGLSDVELGLRLRYAVTPEFAPYVGVNYERRLGAAARFARAQGNDPSDARLVLGIRSWF